MNPFRDLSVTQQAEFSIHTEAGLVVRAASTPDSIVLQQFYEGYDQAFVLPNEKEELSGFAECLALNQAPAYDDLARRFGDFRELVMTASTPDRELGGANFIVYPVPSGRLCVNLNYIYVLPAARRQGKFTPLVDAVREVACALFPQYAAQAPLIFIEQNDPLRMDPRDYERDTEYTGLDQVTRITIWAKLGAKIVDFAYVQPALSEAQEADPNLVYSVLGAEGSSLAACVLRDHLERFFSISVLKGEALESSAEALGQISELSAACQNNVDLRLLDPSAALERLREGTPRRFDELGVGGLRDLARVFQDGQSPRG